MTSILLLKSMLIASSLRSRKKKKKSKTVAAVNPESTNGLCRICNHEQGEVSIFHNFMQPDLPDEIKNFSGVTLSESDDLPKHMCQSCLDLLNGCIMFRELCQKTNKKLIELSIKKEYDKTQQICDVHDIKKVKLKNGEDSDDSYNIPSPTMCIDEAPGWACSACCKEFPDMDTYNNHLSRCKINVPDEDDQKVEGTKKKYLCDTCGKTAYSHASLLIHMAIHENKFPFKCEECPYQGRTKDLLKVHKRSHLVDKPFKCTQCPKATTTASNLAKHMRHVHSTVRPFTCNYCEKAFSYQHDMKRHIKDTHLRQGTVECEVCHKKFNTRKILQGHRWKIHKIKGERQGRLPSYLQCQIEDDLNESSEKYLT